MGPGQRFAVAIIEVCNRLSSRGDTLTLRWVPSQLCIEGNETADDWARVAAGDLGDSVPRAYLREISFAHMTRMAIEARPAGVRDLIMDHVDRRGCYRPPKGQKLQRSSVMRARASRAATTSSCQGMQRWATIYFIKYKGCRQTGAGGAARHHLFVNCEAWKTQIQELWKDVGKRCGWKHGEHPGSPCSSMTRERRKRSCSSFAGRRLGGWSLSHLGM